MEISVSSNNFIVDGIIIPMNSISDIVPKDSREIYNVIYGEKSRIIELDYKLITSPVFATYADLGTWLNTNIVTDFTAVLANTDKIPDIITETDKIPAEVIKTAAIKVETDKIPSEIIKTAAIQAATDKIDGATTLGLLGTSNSLAYIVHEIEKHFHSYERWLGKAVTANAEIHVADMIITYTNTNVVNPFVVDAGNDNWGSWVQVLGSSDTPVIAGSVKFDLHSISFSTNERSGIYFIQVAFGATAAAALAAGTYTALCVSFDAANYGKECNIQHARANAGTKVWVRCLSPGQNTGTIAFYFGVHEYAG